MGIAQRDQPTAAGNPAANLFHPTDKYSQFQEESLCVAEFCQQ
jgi:hypothetical protein